MIFRVRSCIATYRSSLHNSHPSINAVDSSMPGFMLVANSRRQCARGVLKLHFVAFE